MYGGLYYAFLLCLIRIILSSPNVLLFITFMQSVLYAQLLHQLEILLRVS